VSVNEADVDKWRVSPREICARAIFRGPGRSGELQEALQPSREEDEGGREAEAGDDIDGDAPPRPNLQKTAPLVVRVIDDRENMRARKKDPPLAASLLRGILSGGCARPCHTACSGSCWSSGAFPAIHRGRYRSKTYSRSCRFNCA